MIWDVDFGEHSNREWCSFMRIGRRLACHLQTRRCHLMRERVHQQRVPDPLGI